MSNIVYVVHCVDTEGPLYQEKSVPFDMIRNIFGIEVEQTPENLVKMQKGEMELNGYEKEIRELLDSHRIITKGGWDEIDHMLQEITSNKYRNNLPDSRGHGWIFNWFCMDHVGFTGANPRKRDAGYHKIFDRYLSMTKEQNMGDFIGYHYHPLSISGNYNDSGTAYWGNGNLNDILCHRILDRGWFPAAFRPGFHTERPDSHWFLEQWIPFDYGNQSMRVTDEGQKDLAAGRFGDWRRAPIQWYPYHPAHSDYQEKGGCRRWITRCLNMYARTRQISQEDVNDAFEDALKYKCSILAFTDHDYKDMVFEIDRIRAMLKVASKRYQNVEFVYADAIHAMRSCLDLKYEEFELDADLIQKDDEQYLLVKSDKEIFGSQPFLAIKTKDNRYIWDNLDFYEKGRKWTYTFDNNTILLKEVEKIGVAANNSCGVTKVVTLHNEKKNKFEYNILK